MSGRERRLIALVGGSALTARGRRSPNARRSDLFCAHIMRIARVAAAPSPTRRCAATSVQSHSRAGVEAAILRRTAYFSAPTLVRIAAQ
ncbi:hypothetical protein BOC51_04765 [Burkholderia pseudomallei]|nr:hypothetical protein BOC51_04765 [Burkholderia pseudomallei]